ncbi:MAG: FAD binding domain-containing protein [Fusobacteriaceae bacterium]
MAEKKFFTANSFQEALKLKKEHGEKAKYLAGGTELNTRVNKQYYDVLIDIGEIVSKEVKWNTDKTELSIGAGVSFQDMVANENLPPQIRKAAGHMSTRNIRNMATAAGNVGAGSTVGDLLPTFFTLEAELKVADIPERIKVEDYIEKKLDYLIEEIIVKKSNLDKSYDSVAYRRVSSDFSIIGAAATYNKKGDIFTDLRIAVGGMGPKVKRIQKVEQELEGKKLTKEIVMQVMQENIKSRDSLLRGTAQFREYMVAEMVAESLGLI